MLNDLVHSFEFVGQLVLGELLGLVLSARAVEQGIELFVFVVHVLDGFSLLLDDGTANQLSSKGKVLIRCLINVLLYCVKGALKK